MKPAACFVCQNILFSGLFRIPGGSFPGQDGKFRIIDQSAVRIEPEQTGCAAVGERKFRCQVAGSVAVKVGKIAALQRVLCAGQRVGEPGHGKQLPAGGGKAVSIQIPVERPADYGGVKDINAARFVIAGVQLLLRRPCQKQQIQLLRRQLVRPAGSYFRSCPSPPIRAVSSSMRSSGNGGSHNGFKAMDMSFMGLSSAATRLELSAPQRRHL